MQQYNESETSVKETPDDKRLQMYRNMREELIRDDNKVKINAQKVENEAAAKMANANAVQRQKDDQLRKEEDEE